jgi:hypothetical protein
MYIAQGVEVNLARLSLLFGSYAVSPRHEGMSGTGPIFFGASIDSNPLEIYIVLLYCPDLTFSVSAKL